MDPITIALTVAQTSKVVWDVGSSLYELIQDTRVVDETVRNLAAEVTQLQDVCEAVRGQLEFLAKQYADQPGLVSEMQKQEDIRIGSGIEAQLFECNRAMEKLKHAISGVRRNRTNFFKQTIRQISLHISKEQISESRTQIRVHTSNLQLSLHLVTLKTTYLAPKLANQELLLEMKKVKALVEEQKSTNLDSNLIQSAKDILSSGATLYATSIADGSVIGDSRALGGDQKTLEWLERIDFFSNNVSTYGGPIEDSLPPSVFSADNDSRTITTDETSVIGGVPLDTRKDHANDVQNTAEDDESDIELDVQEEIDLDAADTAFQFGSEAFENGEYEAADSDLQEALDLIKDLPMKLHRRYDMFELRFKLAVCAFHTHDADEAEVALASVVNKQSGSDGEALKLCMAGHLLAQVYIKQGKLDIALTTAENSCRVRRKLLGKKDAFYYESLALNSKIFELLNNSPRARAYLRMIPKEAQESACVSLQSLFLPDAALKTLEGHEQAVQAVAFSPDGKTLASASDDKTVRLWDGRSGAALKTLEGHKNRVWAVAFSPDGKTLASASCDKTVRLWDGRSGAALKTLEGHEDLVWAVAFSPDGKTLASASYDKTVRLWDGRSGAALKTLEGHKDWVLAVAFSPDGKTLASASDDKTVRLWDGRSGAALKTLEGHKDRVRAVAFSPDGKTLASASDDKTVRLWDGRSGAALKTLEGHEDRVRAVAFSPDGKTLASASCDKTVRLWDGRSGAALKTLEGHEDLVWAVAFSPDGKTLASASYDWTVRLWDGRSGAALKTLEGHEDLVLAVAFSPDGKTLASASYDWTVRLWDGRSGAALKTLEGHEDLVLAVAFSPDGKTLASASCDRTIKLWK